MDMKNINKCLLHMKCAWPNSSPSVLVYVGSVELEFFQWKIKFISVQSAVILSRVLVAQSLGLALCQQRSQ